MKKKLAVLLLCLAAHSLHAQPTPAQPMQKINEAIFKFGRFIYYLSSSYVDTVNVDNLTEKAIIDVLSALDPHSSYTSAKDAKATTESLLGNFDGIGIEFNMFNDTLLVVSPVAGGPAQKVGIVAGDRIVQVDGKNIAGVSIKNLDVMKMLRGPKGTIVNVRVARRDVEQLLDFTITRDKIPIYSIDAKFWAAPGVAYIRLGRFAATSHAEFVKALDELGKKPEGIILDLRGNAGGMLEASTYIVDEFLSKNELIVYTEGRALPRTDIIATDTINRFEKGKLIILIDENSASASEIVAGAVQDWDRGIIVGRRSFGKGLVQNQIELPDGSLVRITVARYHTPTGRVIQRPYNNGETEKYYKELYQRYANGEVYSLDSIKSFPDSLKFLTLKNRRVVYSGGGVIPDVFVPLDTSTYTSYHARLARMGLINQFTLSYVDANRSRLRQTYKTFKQFNKNFSVSDSLFNELVAFAEEKKLPRNEAEISKAKHDISIQLKGLIAQDIFTTSEYYEVVYPRIDNGYQKALEVMASWKNYEKLLK
ncbi:MAG: S41 family peptidase [Prevotellaceae bacterium]|jgi:carboxyl-terminal processing protease|nr:S41 family peptidase [Prevotellaceae bacterium]